MGLWQRALDASVVRSFDRSGFERHAQGFAAEDLDVSLAGKSCLVTGANRGLGRATTRALARLGATVHMLCRDIDSGREVAEEITATTGNGSIAVHRIDLADLSSVTAFAASFDGPVDVLVHNAGLLPAERTLTAAGLEMTVAVHVVGPWLLTQRLRARLGGSRVVWVSSGGMYTKRLDVDAITRTEGRYDGKAAYALTKRAQVVLSEQWAERLGEQSTTVHAMHPGWAATPGVQKSLPGFWRAMESRLRTPEQGADTIVWLAASDRAASSTGKFWFDRAIAPTHRLPFTRESDEERARLWALCERYA